MEPCIVSNSCMSRQASLMPIDLINEEKSLRSAISFCSPDKIDVIHDDKVHETMKGVVLCPKRHEVTSKCTPDNPLNTLDLSLANMQPRETLPNCGIDACFFTDL